jgi:hypothetical protein
MLTVCVCIYTYIMTLDDGYAAPSKANNWIKNKWIGYMRISLNKIIVKKMKCNEIRPTCIYKCQCVKQPSLPKA